MKLKKKQKISRTIRSDWKFKKVTEIEKLTTSF
jgi:hypothetical protein